MPKIKLEEVGRKVGAPQASGSSITDKWVEYKGARVTEVPAGERFDIYAKGVARNPGALIWEVMITCFSSDGSIAVYDTTDAYGDPYNTPQMKLDSLPAGFQLPVMPNSDITLYFKLWGNDTRGQPVPPPDQW